MKKFSRYISILLVLIITISHINYLTSYAAPAWPSSVGIEAEGGILVDANSGAVLYGQNIHVPYYPASITKILTALIIIENCNLDDNLTFSHNAVYNVESGSSSAGYDEGDTITVRQALYAMLLKSANEAANALAEHCAGSIEAFADMMNEKAAALGCTESHFANPSGLNDENHYTTAYDFSLIAQAAFKNPTFVEINSTTYYELPPSIRNPEGQTIYTHHRMLKKSDSLYYEGIIGGKTGYTILAGNTLVTCAKRGDLELITVILNGHQTHYSDTLALLDFGFNNFKNIKISDYDTSYTSIEADIHPGGYNINDSSVLKIDDTSTMTLPIDATIDDTTSEISYDLTAFDPNNAVAKITYNYSDRVVGHTYLLVDETALSEITGIDETTSADHTPGIDDTSIQPGPHGLDAIPLPVKIIVCVVLGLAVLAGIIFALFKLIKKKKDNEMYIGPGNSTGRHRSRRKRGLF